MIAVSYRWTDLLGHVQVGIIFNETITAASHPYIPRYVDIGDVYLPPMRSVTRYPGFGPTAPILMV